MTEEVKVEEQTTVVVNTDAEVSTEQKVESSAPTLTPHEEKALSQGWKPKDEWVASGGDPEQWRDAASYLDRGEFMRHISAQNKQIRELLEAQKALAEHNRKLAEAAHREEIAELRAAKKAALENNDAEAVVALDEKIDEVKDKLAETKAAAERETVAKVDPAEPHPDFKRWVDRNSWYGQNAELRDYADVIGMRYAKENPGTPPHEVLAHVERKVKETFKHQFSNPNREKPSPVEGGSGNRRASTSKADDYELSPIERKVMNTFVQQGVMTEAEYIKQLKAVNRR